MVNDPSHASPSPPVASGPPAEALEARLARIERVLLALSAEVVAIRAEFGQSSSTAMLPVVPTAARRAAAAVGEPGHGRHGRRSQMHDFEGLIGRYGMLVIAVLAAVAAVGTFLSWAISHRYLQIGPEARLVISVAAAAGLGGWGFRLRRTERSFGSSMIGLALAIMHVCAYAAGPRLQLVAMPLAFSIAAILSWAVALFAYVEGDEPLWCVGFAGAAVAPFVTSGGRGDVYALLLYGVVLLLAASFALRRRDWLIAWRVLYAIAALFTLGGVAVAGASSTVVRDRDLVATLAFPFVVAIGGVMPFAIEQRKRGALRWLAVLAVLVSFSGFGTAAADKWAIAGALLAGIALWLLLLDVYADLPQSSILPSLEDGASVLDWIDAAAVPLLLELRAVDTIGRSMNYWPVLVVAVALFVLFAWRRPVGRLRDAAAFGAMVSALGLIDSLHLEHPLGRVAALSALGLAALAAYRLRPSLSWLLAGCLVLLLGVSASVGALFHRPTYEFTPFMTEPSAGALVVAVSLTLVARSWLALRVATREAMDNRPEWTYAESMRLLLRGIALAPWVWVFVWGVIELSMAFSPSASTLLLVVYFAGTAVACVAVGRVRHSARLRQTGLALALVAAGTAVYGARSYFDTAARIAAYLVTSAFLLGIAYWYRRPGSRPSEVVAPAGEV